MTARTTIKSEIEAKCRNGYAFWRIGLTHDLTESKKHWREVMNQSTGYWTGWTASSLFDAQDIKSHFIDQGMNSVTSGDLSPSKTTYVYVF